MEDPGFVVGLVILAAIAALAAFFYRGVKADVGRMAEALRHAGFEPDGPPRVLHGNLAVTGRWRGRPARISRQVSLPGYWTAAVGHRLGTSHPRQPTRQRPAWLAPGGLVKADREELMLSRQAFRPAPAEVAADLDGLARWAESLEHG